MTDVQEHDMLKTEWWMNPAGGRSGRGFGRAALAGALVAASGGLATVASASALSDYDTPVTLTATDEDGNTVEIDAGALNIDIGAIRGMLAGGRPAAKKDSMPSWKDVSDGFERVVSTTDGQSFYNVFVNRETNQMLAELPAGSSVRSTSSR
jgi:hypothetical protein